MAEGTRARPDSISDFGMQTMQQSQDLMSGFDKMIDAVAASSAVGASGMPEAARLQGTYSAALAAAAQFAQGATDGLTALSYASISIAQNYREGDASQQQEMNGVEAAFAVGPDTRSLQSQRREQAAAARQEQAEVNRAYRQSGETPPDDDWRDGQVSDRPAEDAPEVCEPATAMDHVEAHRDEYGEAEKDYDPAAEQAAAEAARPQTSPTGSPQPTPSGPMNSPGGSNGAGLPTASPGPSPSPGTD
jgi:hypothetical protein